MSRKAQPIDDPSLGEVLAGLLRAQGYRIESTPAAAKGNGAPPPDVDDQPDPDYVREAMRSELASRLECFTAEEVALLARVQVGSALQWNSTGSGPRSVRLGDARLFPIEGVRAFLTRQLTEGGKQ